MKVSIENVPDELKARPQWVVWRSVVRKGKSTKMPIDSHTLEPASSTDSRSWHSIGDAMAAVEMDGSLDGIGYVFAEDDPYVGIDFDDCLSGAEGGPVENAAGVGAGSASQTNTGSPSSPLRVTPTIQQWLTRLNTYTEISPSGRGVKLWVEGSLAGTGKNVGWCEMYDRGRFFTVTGNRLTAATTIRIDQQSIDELYALITKKEERAGGPDTEGVDGARTDPTPQTGSPSPSSPSASAPGRKSPYERCLLYLQKTPDAVSGNRGHDATLRCACETQRFGLDDIDAMRVLNWFNSTKTAGEAWSDKELRHKLDAAQAKVAADGEVGVRLKQGKKRSSVAVASPSPSPAPTSRAKPKFEVNDNGWPVGERIVIPEPLRLAEKFIRERVQDEGQRLQLRRFRKEFWMHRDGGYSVIDNEDVDHLLYDWVDTLWVAEVDREGSPTGEIKKLVPRGHLINEIERAMITRGMLVAGEMPQWTDGGDHPVPKNVISFRNGYLNLSTWLAGDDAFAPPDPNWFNAACCPFDFDRDATCPQWLKFLRDVLVDDQSIALLQEWFGLQLVPDNTHEKIMLIVGRPRSGKGTMLAVLEAMLGEQLAYTNFLKLTGRFGLSPLMGRLTAVMPDAELPKSADSRVVLEIIKSISGNDPQSVDRKGISELPNVRLSCRFTIAANQLPDLPDDVGAIKPRLLMLHCPNTYAGQEDKTLKLRLPLEAPGVANWALQGLARLRENGEFTTPERSEAMTRSFEHLLSPILTFIDERCELAADTHTVCDDLYSAWKIWRKLRGETVGSKIQFGMKLGNAVPAVERVKRGPRGQQFWCYAGVRLMPETPETPGEQEEGELYD